MLYAKYKGVPATQITSIGIIMLLTQLTLSVKFAYRLVRSTGNQFTTFANFI